MSRGWWRPDHVTSIVTPDWCSALVGVSREGLQELRTGLAGVRSQVDTDRSDVLATLAEMTRSVAPPPLTII